MNTPTPVAYGRFMVQDRRRRGIDYWIRRFNCPDRACADTRTSHKPQTLGRQTVRASYDPEAGYALSGYFVERVEVVLGLIELGISRDGTLSIGLSRRARRGAGGPARLRKAQPVLGDDPAHVGRHDPRRDPLPTRSYWSLEPRAIGRACIITCPNCKHRYLLDGKFSDVELKRH